MVTWDTEDTFADKDADTTSGADSAHEDDGERALFLAELKEQIADGTYKPSVGSISIQLIQDLSGKAS